MPLEGLWWIENGDFDLSNKSNWQWTLMVRQPNFINEQHLETARIDVHKKKQLDNLSNVSLNHFTEGLAIQTLHLGPYSEEQGTIDNLHKYIKEKGYQRNGKHHEIYLNDPTRTSPEKLKTIIRQPIK